VEEAVRSARLVRFGTFEVDLPAGELRKSGVKLRLTGQPFQVLTILLERPGEVVTREELQKRLWPDTFVDVDHNLNTAINKIREVLGDSAESPRFVETLPRRGYRFVAPVEGTQTTEVPGGSGVRQESRIPWVRRTSILFVVLVLLAAVGFFIYRRLQSPASLAQRTLTRLTFDDGLQIGATWSPDGRFIAYSSNRGGKFDIWVQQVSGGDPVQITKGPGHNWQPDWSPDGKYIAYRSEDGEGGLFVIPALGGEGLARKIASFGFYPRWSPDSSQILFRTYFTWMVTDSFYVVDLDGSEPRQVLADFGSQRKLWVISTAWHPDGKRISIWAREGVASPSFWTVPVTGGVAVRSEIAPEIVRQLGEILSVGRAPFEPKRSSSVHGFGPRWFPAMDFEFSWAPSGKAIYFERTLRGAKNLWRMTVDPDTLRATAIERLTTGPGLDTQLAVSADEGKLAFTGETQHVRVWLFPFDASSGRVTGKGIAVTSPGMEAWMPTLSPDGKKLAFCSIRAGKWQLWQKSLVDGREAPIVADDDRRDLPQWSPDGTRLAYRHEKSSTGESQLVVWSSESHNEQPILASSPGVYDWTADGKWLLASLESSDTHGEIWLMPVVAAGSHAGPEARKIISDPAYDLFQSHFSPDGRWIVFEAVRYSPVESTLYVMPAAGGPWTLISKGKPWDDKPRWSPDGKTIYFVSARSGFFNVWGIRFDSTKGKPVGEAFRVTAFENPGLMIPDLIPLVELSLNQDKLMLTMEERSGSIWLLDNVSP
jgi:Tol biopolymer transport system component/DNA-binding winged helix-turn-helix (wHTH) protein